MSEFDEIDDVRRLEQRGKTADSARTTASQRRRVLQAFKRALASGNERDFLETIRRDLGLKDGTPEFVRAVQVWRKTRGVS